MPEKANLPEQFQRIFGKRVKERRRALHLTRLELSERLQISRTMLANIETGTQRTSVLLLARLRQALEVPVGDLVPSIAEAEQQLEQSRKVSLSTEAKPELLIRALKELDISVKTGSSLQEALKEVLRQDSLPKPKSRR